jgi:archaeal flagellar protein FlaJ
MRINTLHYIGIGIGMAVLLISLFFMGKSFFFLIMGIGVIIIALPFVLSAINETRSNAEKEEMFLEFARNLVESVKAGTPISKSILNVKNKSYGVLTPHVKKLANQISMGIPLRNALEIFSKDMDNPVVSRALTLISQAERAGGDIGEILESVAGAVSMSDKLKKERKAAISTLVVQGYIIFLVFIVIVLVMQFKILPMMAGISSFGDMGGGGLGSIGVAGGTGGESEDLAGSFLYLLLVQGCFSGLAIGKLAEGSLKAGIKHSFALMLLSFLSSAIANILLA